MNAKHPTLDSLQLLVEVSQILALRDLDGALKEVIDLAGKAVGATRASLFLHQEGGVDWDHIFTARDLPPDQSFEVVTRVLDEGFAGWVFRNKRGDIIHDTETDDRWIVFEGDTVPVRSVLCVPFLHDDEVMAVLTLTHSKPNHFTAYDLQLMTLIANQFTIAVRNAGFFHHIQAEQRRQQTILQSITDALLVLNEDGSILMLNEAAVPLLGVEFQGDAVNKPLADFVAVDPVFERIVQIVRSAGDSKETWIFEERSERRQQDFQVTMSIWRDRLEDVAGYVVVMHDVTTLRDLHRFKDEMLRVASHDLRSPLALITGYVDMIDLDTPDETSPVHQYVQVVKRTTERMGNLLDDLLRVERIRSSPLELHEKTDPAQLVKVVLVNMRLMANNKKQTLTSEIELDGVPHIVADPVLIRQSMENLIGNAIKYTPEGGQISVKATYDAKRFNFSVKDTGIGIAAEHIPRLFESFFRVDEITSEEKGSGLGLSLVKNVIQRHNGEVWVNSTVGEGSEFGFWLPLA